MAYTFKHGDRPLEGFAIQRAVGRGGFGEVYYAVSDGGREVALKYLRENPQVELRGVAHCINLKSPHLVSIFDVKKNDDGDYFVIMEYVSGPSLRDLLIAEPNGIGPQKAAYFVREIAKGLGYLHDRGIVHRDLKPGNIFYDEGYVKIGDYGLSKFISVSRHSAQTASVGTVHYMAPEVGSGSYTRGIDIYALGVMLYEMLLGKVPFEGSSMGEVLMKHLTEQPEVDNLPQPFGRIIHKALQKDPKDRYQSVYELIDDLMEVDDVRTSLAGFNPVSLSGATRRLPVGDDSPAPSPNPSPRQIPVARPQRGPVFSLDAGSLPPEMVKRVQRTSSKVEKRMRKLDSKHGIKHPPAPQVETPKVIRPHLSSDAPATKREFLQRALLALLMAVCLGFGVAMVNDMGEAGYVSSILMIVGMSGGLAIGVRALARASRNRMQPRWVEKIFLAVPVLILAGLGAAPLTDLTRNDDLVLAVVGAMVGLALVGNWRKRIDSGARGKLSIGYAFTAGLFALIATAIMSDGYEDFMFFAAGVAASVSLVFEALSWLFPLKDWMAGVTPELTGTNDGGRQNAPSSNDGVEWEPQNQRSLETVAHPNRFADPEDSGIHRAMHDDGNLLEPASTFAAPQPPLRWPITRVFAALLGFACLVGLVFATVYLVSGEPSGTVEQSNVNGVMIYKYPRRSLNSNEFIPTAMVAAGCLGMMMFAFRKVSRHRTQGFYGDTFRPIMITLFLVSMTYGASILIRGNGPHRVVPGRVILIVSLIMFIVLLFIRGRRWRESHRAHSETRQRRDEYDHDAQRHAVPQPSEQA
ncbi:MAG: serine/threonine protein kinase [Phycisphaerales bacterium]|nr:serine/threonine protein kinase [Phycisphaerales bacterium]